MEEENGVQEVAAREFLGLEFGNASRYELETEVGCDIADQGLGPWRATISKQAHAAGLQIDIEELRLLGCELLEGIARSHVSEWHEIMEDMKANGGPGPGGRNRMSGGNICESLRETADEFIEKKGGKAAACAFLMMAGKADLARYTKELSIPTKEEHARRFASDARSIWEMWWDGEIAVGTELEGLLSKDEEPQAVKIGLESKAIDGA